MISRFHAGAHWRAWTTAGGFVAVLISLGTPVFAQSVKETRVSFPSANAQQNGYEHAALDIIYRATSCGGGIHVGYAVEPGSLDVTNGYWYEGHRYAIEAGWPQPRSQSFAIQMNAKHGARTIREWEKRDPITTDKVGCDNAVEFFYVAGGWEALLGDQAGDRAARENALASISLSTPYHADRTLRNPDIESLIRRQLAAAEAERAAEQRAQEARKAEEARRAEAARAEEALRQEQAASEAEAARVAQTAGQASADPADPAAAYAAEEAAEREEAQRRQEALEAEERHAQLVERQRVEEERRREEERQAAVNELGNTLERGLLAGVAITAYTALPAVANEGVSQEFGLRFGQVGERSALLFGFGTNDLSFLSGGESTTNQMSFTAGGEIGVAPPGIGLSKAFMPYLGGYYKTVEFYEDLTYDQEEETWETWGFNVGFMGVLGDVLVYQAGLMGDLGTPEINYMRGSDGGFFVSLGFQLGS